MIAARVDAVALAAQGFLFLAFPMTVWESVRDDVDYAHIAGGERPRILSEKRIVET